MGDATPPLSTGQTLRVAVLTTSYPLVSGNTSGIFIARLLEAMPDDITLSVITPASCVDTPRPAHKNLRILPVRYAPKTWQRLAHQPGGLPVALRGSPRLRALVPFLVAALAARTLWEARTHHLIHANWAFNGCVAGMVGILTGRPVLTSLRGEDISRAKKPGFPRWTLKLAIALSRTIVAVSTDMAKQLRDDFPAAARKIVVVENGVDDAFLAACNTRRNRLLHPLPVLVCAGNLIPRKGHSVLLRALAQCADFAWRVKLAGEGPEHAELARLATELGLADRIEFSGELPPDAMPAFLANADLFILPSFSEGRSNALVEAMASGLPVVASDIDGVRELVEDGRTGRLFPPGDERVLASVLRSLLRDASTLSEFGNAAHAEICRRQLTWAGAADKYAVLYRQMLERS
jgi:glycosyltransferase involved in cell wall biosynthesis